MEGDSVAVHRLPRQRPEHHKYQSALQNVLLGFDHRQLSPRYLEEKTIRKGTMFRAVQQIRLNQPSIFRTVRMTASTGVTISTTGSIGNAAAAAKVSRVCLLTGRIPICRMTVKLPPRSIKDDASGFPKIGGSCELFFRIHFVSNI